MKTALKPKNDEFFDKNLKHLSGLTGHANPHGTTQLWEMLMKTAKKHENDDFWVITLIVNLPRTRKPRAIAHENDLITRNR
jgi:hypothetical protein